MLTPVLALLALTNRVSTTRLYFTYDYHLLTR
jgi:hypothetical protein